MLKRYAKKKETKTSDKNYIKSYAQCLHVSYFPPDGRLSLSEIIDYNPPKNIMDVLKIISNQIVLKSD